MSSGTRKDPFPAYCFKVKLNGVAGQSDATAIFKSVSGLKYETEVTDFAEGGENGFTHRLVGTTKWGNIVLKRGFIAGFDLVKWRQEWLKPTGKPSRISGEIIQLDTKLKEICRWKFKDAWPCKWEISEFDGSKSELSIETIELAHHGLEFST